MADKFMKIGGRDENNQARPIRTNTNGDQYVQLTGSFAEYRILSTDTYPEAKPEEKGATLVIMDTGEVFMNHGSNWEVW